MAEFKTIVNLTYILVLLSVFSIVSSLVWFGFVLSAIFYAEVSLAKDVSSLSGLKLPAVRLVMNDVTELAQRQVLFLSAPSWYFNQNSHQILLPCKGQSMVKLVPQSTKRHWQLEEDVRLFRD